MNSVLRVFVKVMNCKIILIMPPCKHFFFFVDQISPVSKCICEIKYFQNFFKPLLLRTVNAFVSCHLNPLTWTFHKDAI